MLDLGFELEFGLVIVVRRWVENAARRIPNIAPRVPPIFSTMGRRVFRRVGMEPEVCGMMFVFNFAIMAVSRSGLG